MYPVFYICTSSLPLPIFRHDDDGIPVKAILLDITFCSWGSPCADLAYFLYSSTSPMLRATHMEEMLGYYHDTLIKCLWELGEDATIYPYRLNILFINKR